MNLSKLGLVFALALVLGACGKSNNKNNTNPGTQTGGSSQSVLEGTWLTNLSQIDGKIRRITVNGNSMLYEVFNAYDDLDNSSTHYTISIVQKSSPNGYMTYEINGAGTFKVFRVDSGSIVIGPSQNEYQRYYKQ